MTKTMEYLLEKYTQCETKEGREIIATAIYLVPKFPGLTGAELVKLAYWGASGENPLQ